MVKRLPIRLALVSLLCLLSASPALPAGYALFGGFIPEGTPTIDGKITPGEWDALGHITTYKFFGEDSKVEVYFMWDDRYLYLGAEVEDFELWVDNFDPATPWVSTWDDDAFKWEIDPDRSRDEYLQPTDRSFAVNANGSALRLDRGDGAGNTVGAPPLDPLNVKVLLQGVLNDHTFSSITRHEERDRGYTLEVALSWRNIFGSETLPTIHDGYALGMNFANIEDDTGGSLDPEYYPEWKRVKDEITRFMGEEGCPENWAEWVLSGVDDRTPPGTVTDLLASPAGPFSLSLSFSATGDNANAGHARAYDIRYAPTPLTEETWAAATPYQNAYRPAAAGARELLRLTGLSPATTYHVGIKALDERGNVSGLATASCTTTAQTLPGDKGFLTVSPGRRYLCWENGDPFLVIGDNQGMAWPNVRSLYNGPMWEESLKQWVNYYLLEGPQKGREYLSNLNEHGVNTVRIIAEDMQTAHPIYLYENVSGGPSSIVYNNATLDFLKTYLDACADYGISVIIVPFDTFYYRSNWAVHPFNKANGGPLSDPSELYEPICRDFLKAILKKLVDTIGDRRNLLAWDIVNEFDSDEPGIGWTRATFAKKEAAVNDLLAYVKSIDPHHMVYLSSVRWDPKFTSHIPTTSMTSVTGADPALILNNDLSDFNSTHTYYHDIRDPNLNHPNNRTSPDGSFTYRLEMTDIDNTIAPAARIKQGLQFYFANTLNPKPYFNTEAGPICFFTTEYDAFFTQEDDNIFFHNMIWSFVASGDVGTGLRWPGEMLESHALSDQMRRYQLALKNILSSHIDFLHSSPTPVGHYLEIGGTAVPMIKTGISDGKQGILFLVKDTRKADYGDVAQATLSIPGLEPLGRYAFEFWDSYDPAKTAPDLSMSIVADVDGEAQVSLPAFALSQVIKFYRTGTEAPTTGYCVTEHLWIRAVLKPSWVPHLDLRWVKGGEDISSAGDRTVWGYFYADPKDFPYGNANNPEVFVKIYIAANGWQNVAFNHVTVDDVDVYSAYDYQGSYHQKGTVTLQQRVIANAYDTGTSTAPPRESRRSAPSPIPKASMTRMPSGSTSGWFQATSHLSIMAVLKPTWMPHVTLQWRQKGIDTSVAGDTTVWGYFYADPDAFPYGSPSNPEVFVKIYLANNGWQNIAFNHVTVDDVDVFSAYDYDGKADQSGTISLGSRVAAHPY